LPTEELGADSVAVRFQPSGEDEARAIVFGHLLRRVQQGQHLRRALPPKHRPASLTGLALRVQGHFRGKGLLAGGRPRTVPGTVRLSHRTALATLARAEE